MNNVASRPAVARLEKWYDKMGWVGVGWGGMGRNGARRAWAGRGGAGWVGWRGWVGGDGGGEAASGWQVAAGGLCESWPT